MTFAEYSVAMDGALSGELLRHLIRADGQEDLCFALWRPSSGTRRFSAVLVDVILPRQGERHVHGNASFEASYFERAVGLALEHGAGLAFLHSHPFPGWQGLSADDVEAERNHAAAAFGATGLPLLGLTCGNDGAWSARFWVREAPGAYGRRWCRSVRTVASQLVLSFADHLYPPPPPQPELLRTRHAWGDAAQAQLARTRVGVIGTGSVGAIVAEALGRTGFEDVVLVDFDRVKTHNLDRLLHATSEDAKAERLKVDLAAEALRKYAVADRFAVHPVSKGVHELDGYLAAVDCDVLISCVDRPLARHVLNLVAQAHMIPVVDGGIAVRRTKAAGLVGADWRAHTTGPGMRCLACIGQYDVGLVQADREGLLDRASYIESLPEDHPLRQRENVFGFSASCASFQFLQLIQMIVAPLGCASPGLQMYHFVTGMLDTEFDPVACEPHCSFKALRGQGDAVRDLLGIA